MNDRNYTMIQITLGLYVYTLFLYVAVIVKHYVSFVSCELHTIQVDLKQFRYELSNLK